MSHFVIILWSDLFHHWTISATQLVLKAHKEAVNSLSGNGSAKLGTVATVVAAANSTALECSKEIEAAMQISLRNALGVMTNKTPDGPMDDLTIMRVQSSPVFIFLSPYVVDLQCNKSPDHMLICTFWNRSIYSLWFLLPCGPFFYCLFNSLVFEMLFVETSHF